MGDNLLGQRIREARIRRGLSQAQLAGEDLTKAYISMIESGRAIPSRKTLKIITSRLSEPLSYFADGYETVEEEASVLISLAEASIDRRNWDEAQSRLAEAKSLLESSADGPLLRRLKLRIGQLLCEQGNEDGLGILQEVATNSEVLLDPVALSLAHLYRGNFLFSRADIIEALDEYLKSYGVLRDSLSSTQPDRQQFNELERRKLLVRILANIGDTCRKLGRVEASLGYYQEALLLGRELVDPYRLGVVCMGLGLAYYRAGNLPRALEYAEKSKGLFQSLRDTRLVAAVLNNLGLVYREAGLADRALGLFEESLVIKRRLGLEQDIAYTLEEIAREHVSRGDLPRAMRTCEEALVLLTENRDEIQEGRVRLVVASAHQHLGNTEVAEAELSRAKDLFEKAGARKELSEACFQLGTLLKSLGRYLEASEAFHQGVQALEHSKKVAAIPLKPSVKDDSEAALSGS